MIINNEYIVVYNFSKFALKNKNNGNIIDFERNKNYEITGEYYEMGVIPDKNKLDELYDNYCKKTNRNVEGFVVNYENRITKYVRMKNGKLTEHFDRGE